MLCLFVSVWMDTCHPPHYRHPVPSHHAEHLWRTYLVWAVPDINLWEGWVALCFPQPGLASLQKRAIFASVGTFQAELDVQTIESLTAPATLASVSQENFDCQTHPPLGQENGCHPLLHEDHSLEQLFIGILLWRLLELLLVLLNPAFYALLIVSFTRFLVPVSMIICNDIMAYIFGFFFGKTPLIKLSPKKTWEGFIGGAFATIIWGLLVSHFETWIGKLLLYQSDRGALVLEMVSFDAHLLCRFPMFWCSLTTLFVPLNTTKWRSHSPLIAKGLLSLGWQSIQCQLLWSISVGW